MKRTASKFVVAAMVLCCVLMPSIPSLYAKWNDHQLLGTNRHRPQIEGMLDEQVQNVPILYALFCQRYLTGSELPYVNPVDGEPLPTDEAAKTIVQQERMEQIIAKTQELIRAGALPQNLNEELERQKQLEPKETAVNREEGGFLTARYCVQDGAEIQIRVHESTGLVTYFNGCCGPTVQDSQKNSCEVQLKNYRDYLGLSMLEDWKELHGEGSEGLWSAMGQVYLFCSNRGDENQGHLEIGAYSLALDQFFASSEG